MVTTATSMAETGASNVALFGEGWALSKEECWLAFKKFTLVRGEKR